MKEGGRQLIFPESQMQEVAERTFLREKLSNFFVSAVYWCVEHEQAEWESVVEHFSSWITIVGRKPRNVVIVHAEWDDPNGYSELLGLWPIANRDAEYRMLLFEKTVEVHEGEEEESHMNFFLITDPHKIRQSEEKRENGKILPYPRRLESIETQKGPSKTQKLLNAMSRAIIDSFSSGKRISVSIKGVAEYLTSLEETIGRSKHKPPKTSFAFLLRSLRQQ